MTRLLWIFLLFLMSPLAHGVELLGRPEVQANGGAVTLRWKTDVACGTRVSYGLASSKMDQKAEGPVTAEHEVTLTDLKTGGTYYFQLGSARQSLYAGNFTVTGSAQPTAPPTTAEPARSSMLDKVIGIFSPDQKPAARPPGAVAPSRAPPTRETWGRLDTLRDHFERHGPDSQSRSQDEYAANAWLLLQKGRAGKAAMKWDDADGTLRVFESQTGAFGAYNREGKTKTFFRPGNASYWQRQPGRPVKSADLPF